MNYLNVTDLSRKENDGFALENISFTLTSLQRMAVAGETGSGKSTLLKIIAGLVQPDSGEVTFRGKRVEGPLEKLVPGHSGISYLSQHFELPKFLRVGQVLSYANALSVSEAGIIYEICQIDHLQKRATDQLSGGERQRIALARALISSPSLLLLDEPFSNLDRPHKITLKKIINDLSAELMITCILVSHDPDDSLSWADRILVMKNGKALQYDSPQQVYRQPVDEYTAGLFGTYNRIDGEIAEQLGLVQKYPTFLRPEDFTVGKGSSKGIKGKVSDVHYFGSHFEISIAARDKIFFARTDVGDFVSGEDVVFSLRSNVK
jgi:ABC-type glutathione transport system ATPase component